jgi:hypothetical protein
MFIARQARFILYTFHEKKFDEWVVSTRHTTQTMKTLVKSTLASLLAVALGCSVSTLQAQTPASSAAPMTSPAKEKHPPFHGVVSGVDAATKTFTFTSKKGNVRSFTMGADSVVMNGEAAATFADIKVGSYVRGTSKKIAEGKFEVVKAIIGEKPAKAEASPAASAAPEASPMKKKGKKKKGVMMSPSPSPAQ